MEKNSTSGKKQVVVFDIDSQGNVTQQLTDNPQETTLENSLLQALYPDIKVAIVNVPSGAILLNAFPQEFVDRVAELTGGNQHASAHRKS